MDDAGSLADAWARVERGEAAFVASFHADGTPTSGHRWGRNARRLAEAEATKHPDAVWRALAKGDDPFASYWKGRREGFAGRSGDREDAEREAQADAKDAEAALNVRVVSFEDFGAVDEPGADPLLGTDDEVVLPKGGDAMLYGLPGANKSTLADDLAFHLSAGLPWLDIPCPAPARVLIVENEGPRALRRKRLRARAEGLHPLERPDGLFVWEHPWASVRLDREHWREALAEQVAALDIGLVILGPLRSLGMEGHGTLFDVEAFASKIADVRERAGVPVSSLVLHHENRAGNVSGVWEGAVETLLQAQGRGHGKARLVFEKCRWASAYHATGLDLAWRDPFSFEVIDKPAPTSPVEMDALIVDAVGRLPGAAWKALENSLPGTRAQRLDARDRLLTEGRIVNLAKGENGTAAVLRRIEDGVRAQLYLPDDPAVAPIVENLW
jgi:hypothetical protein